jgi:hypothetical protein
VRGKQGESRSAAIDRRPLWRKTDADGLSVHHLGAVELDQQLYAADISMQHARAVFPRSRQMIPTAQVRLYRCVSAGLSSMAREKVGAVFPYCRGYR